MDTLHGQHFIGRTHSRAGAATFRAANPALAADMEPAFPEATASEADQAMRLAAEAFQAYRKVASDRRAAFLNAIADEVERIGDALTERAGAETGLPAARLVGERGRTTGQLRLFASLVAEGSWVDARIDRAAPDRKPLPKPDVRRMLLAIGPVVVFGASNFPLAFSSAGGDTASALAAGCPVVVKAHPAHPGTSELVAGAVLRAAAATDMPDGVFSMLHGRTPETSLALVRHPAAAAVAFTGSLRAGRAIFDAAAARPSPIPVYAEMGSVNPVFVLPEAMAQRGPQIAEGIKASVTLGVGQFCTCPGLVVALDGAETRQMISSAGDLMRGAPAGTMLNAAICRGYADGVKRFERLPGVRVAGRAEQGGDIGKTQATPVLFATDAAAFLAEHAMAEELFGPASLVVTARTPAELEQVAERLEGQLTATIHGTEAELPKYGRLVEILEQRAGRLLFNGFPVGVEVCASMVHGGPYPATTDSRSTSVGTGAILRFARPVCYQGFPQPALPPELRDANPRGLWRTVDNVLGQH